jgi:hypothetical protein
MLDRMADDTRHVPTLPVPVELGLATGRTVRGTVSLSITSPMRSDPETLDEFLNTKRWFIPLQDEARQNGNLVARDAIAVVRLVSEIAPRSVDIAPAIDLIHVELSTGQVVDGALQHGQRERLSDFFNAVPDFFALDDGDGVVYVNKLHVIAINL